MIIIINEYNHEYNNLFIINYNYLLYIIIMYNNYNNIYIYIIIYIYNG